MAHVDPFEQKASTNSGACLFAFSASALQSQTGRLGFHSPSGPGLVSSVMDRPAVPHAEIASSFREQEGRTSTSSITLTLTFCALAAGGDEERRPRIGSAAFFFVASHEGPHARNTRLPFVTQLRQISETGRAPAACAAPLAACLYDAEHMERRSFPKKKGAFGAKSVKFCKLHFNLRSGVFSVCAIFAPVALTHRRRY